MNYSPDQSERTCATCERILAIDSKGIQSGYYCCDEYFCNEDCLKKSFINSHEDIDKHFTDDGDCYFTEWENETVNTNIAMAV